MGDADARDLAVAGFGGISQRQQRIEPEANQQYAKKRCDQQKDDGPISGARGSRRGTKHRLVSGR